MNKTIENDFNKNLLYCIQKFSKNKLLSLSNRLVKDENMFSYVINALNNNLNHIQELSILIKKARNCGLIGINTYYKPLEKLYNYFTKKNPLKKLEEFNEDIIIEFLASATSRLSDSSKKNYRIAMISFFAFLDRENKKNNSFYIFDILLKNWGGLKYKNTNKLPAYLSENEIKRFLFSLENYKFHTNLVSRNKLIIKLILYTGMRVSELIYLKTKDILKDKDMYILKITGKGNKQRILIVKAIHIQKELENYLDIKEKNVDFLFYNKNYQPLTQSYISRLVEKILISASIRKEKNGAHMLRHSYATLLYKKKKDIVLVQETLGHSNLETSRIYTHFDKDRLREAADIIDDL